MWILMLQKLNDLSQVYDTYSYNFVQLEAKQYLTRCCFFEIWIFSFLIRMIQGYPGDILQRIMKSILFLSRSFNTRMFDKFNNEWTAVVWMSATKCYDAICIRHTILDHVKSILCCLISL